MEAGLIALTPADSFSNQRREAELRSIRFGLGDTSALEPREKMLGRAHAIEKRKKGVSSPFPPRQASR